MKNKNMVEIRLSYGGSFAALECTKELPLKTILNDFSQRTGNHLIDWMPNKDNDSVFGLLTVDDDGEKELEERIKQLPSEDSDYTVIQSA